MFDGFIPAYLLMSSPFPSHFLLRHVFFPHSMSGFGGAAVDAATVSSEFSAAAEVDEELDGVVEI